MIATTKERARGQWRNLLPAIGIANSFLSGRNCPCPMCGGRDRFRFLDRRGQDGDGMWVCNQCTPKPRPAIDLVMKFTGKPFREAIRLIDDILGDKRVSVPITPIRPPEPSNSPSARFKRTWRRGLPIRLGDVADRYLRSRGIGMDIYPSCLRVSPLDWYQEKHFEPDPEDGPHYGTQLIYECRIPAMFAAITNLKGQHIATHRTYLADDGSAKANVSTPRKVVGRFGQGPTIRLAPAAPTMGIAEGIETALSATKLFRIPTWSVICATGIETFVPPPECERLVIFADNDAHGRGQLAAETLADRLLRSRLAVDIEIPHLKDWNDVLMEHRR
jgi:putative DNA primase/helicase